MAVQTDIPTDLTDADRAFMFQLLNAHLHSKMLYSLLHGARVYLADQIAVSNHGHTRCIHWNCRRYALEYL